MSQLLALLDLLSRLLDLVGRMVKRAKRREREQRNEQIDSDPADEFIDKFDGLRDGQQPSVPGDSADTEPDQNRGGRDQADRR